MRLMLPPLYVLRHGETEWNRADRMQGGLDSPLTPLGRSQALAMGRALAAAGVGPQTHDALCSPQGRARDTAALALGPLGMQAQADSRLREIAMGQWAGLARSEIAARWPGPSDEGLVAFYSRAPEGEGFVALWARVGAVLAEIRRPTVIVTHGMTSRALRALAMGLALDRIGDLPGGQGIVFEIRDGVSRILPVDGLPQRDATANAAT